MVSKKSGITFDFSLSWGRCRCSIRILQSLKKKVSKRLSGWCCLFCDLFLVSKGVVTLLAIKIHCLTDVVKFAAQCCPVTRCFACLQRLWSHSFGGLYPLLSSEFVWQLSYFCLKVGLGVRCFLTRLPQLFFLDLLYDSKGLRLTGARYLLRLLGKLNFYPADL